MKALVTGVTGFIGSHVAELLLRHGHEVFGVAQHHWHPDAPTQLVDSAALFRWNIEHPAPETLVHKIVDFCPDVFFHFAGLSIPSQCGEDAPSPQALAINVEGTAHVMQLAKQLPQAPRLVFASTCHVYEHVSKERPFVTEQAPLRPVSAYGETKLLCEQMIQREMQQSSLPACIVRGFHHIGPRQPAGLMLTDWLAQVGPDCTEITVRSNNSYLDLVDVRDAARAYYLLATTPSCLSVCNLGSGQVSRSGDVLDALLGNLDHPLRINVQSQQERWNPIADITQLQALGWQSEIHYGETICDMMACRSPT